jgi:hypothetical protein
MAQFEFVRMAAGLPNADAHAAARCGLPGGLELDLGLLPISRLHFSFFGSITKKSLLRLEPQGFFR